MTGEVIIALSTIGFLVVTNIVIVVFSYGKLVQGFTDLSKEVANLSRKVDNTDMHLDKLTERIARIEGKLEDNT